MIRWLARIFWDECKHPPTETQWNMVQEEDAWEGVRYQLERIAEALEHWRGLQ